MQGRLDRGPIAHEIAAPAAVEADLRRRPRNPRQVVRRELERAVQSGLAEPLAEAVELLGDGHGEHLELADSCGAGALPPGRNDLGEIVHLRRAVDRDERLAVDPHVPRVEEELHDVVDEILRRHL